MDVAKQAADLVLLEKNLDVLIEGVGQGRTTFAQSAGTRFTWWQNPISADAATAHIASNNRRQADAFAIPASCGGLR